MACVACLFAINVCFGLLQDGKKCLGSLLFVLGRENLSYIEEEKKDIMLKASSLSVETKHSKIFIYLIFNGLLKISGSITVSVSKE